MAHVCYVGNQHQDILRLLYNNILRLLYNNILRLSRLVLSIDCPFCFLCALQG
jgi:hypothetical protein